MKRRGGYRSGDHLAVCDRTGFVHYASDMRREWNGALVHKDVFEARHPQDFLRSRRDNMRVENPRTRPIDTYIGPLVTEITEDAAAGLHTIAVLHSERMQVGDSVGVMLDNTDTFRSTIGQILSATSLFLNDPLPGSASSGNLVINYTAVAPSVLE